MSTTHESGTYFKSICADLPRQAPEFPTGDPSPNLQLRIDEIPEKIRVRMA
jgi:hypothetical protein